jgi:hypothetical protein
MGTGAAAPRPDKEDTTFSTASMPDVNGPDTARRGTPPRATRLHVIDVTQIS